MPVTIRDVARRAEVSVATVSRALGSPDRVSAATRARVLEIVRELGYRPSPAARSLITGKTGAIAIVVPDLGNPFFTGVLKSVQAQARHTGHAVLVGDSDEDPATEQELVRTMAKQADGVLLCSPGIDDATITELAGLTPLALLNRRVAGIGATVMDSAGGMREIVAHLAALGHRRCAYLNGPLTSWSNSERLRGLRSAAAAHDVEIRELGPFAPRYEDGAPAADQALAAGVTAVLAYNDVMALGALARLRERGVAVPEEVSVTGFDDLVYAAVSAPPLTTVAMPLAESGRRAVDLVLAHSAAEAAGRVVTELPTRLVVRASTGPVRENR
ncbi:LacI family DNA-binding transcriptional regulator [Amycolatopsis sp. FDAARGOS 1241]|uniref:LacI family DNA-binding transcriptional regulator n=1 Tax=Amycolatopsis sp. FDAARGOS 1241 TaxID=2778070 RepID=UPI001950A8C9|nr:LacI family DNA-binding transcriptional regulator [Amycolatopsis sp. FDAARGOS 1241]QRP43278.1 LacI family DNA-binding transcriptional regulator [Amycolatopsis sp. FDAARGOS 1241]